MHRRFGPLVHRSCLVAERNDRRSQRRGSDVRPVACNVGPASHASLLLRRRLFEPQDVQRGSQERRGLRSMASQQGRSTAKTDRHLCRRLARTTNTATCRGRRRKWTVPAEQAAVRPLWFLLVSLAIVALTPVMLDVHRRGPVVTIVAIAGTIVVVDVLRFGVALDGVGWVNLALVWLFAHQLGFFYADGSLVAGGLRLHTAMAAAGFIAMIVLTNIGTYPAAWWVPMWNGSRT
jgi:hypothetical protein